MDALKGKILRLEKQNRYMRIGIVTAAIVIAGSGIIGFLLSFHIFYGPWALIPKDYLSFADTFVTVDEYLERYNNASFIERVSLLNSNLHRRLKERGMIRIISETEEQGVERNQEGESAKTWDRSGRDSISPTDFEILRCRGEWDDFGYFRVIAEVRNNASVAAGVEVEASAYDSSGMWIANKRFWPNSISNIPPNGVLRIDHHVTQDARASRMEISVIEAKVWK